MLSLSSHYFKIMQRAANGQSTLPLIIKTDKLFVLSIKTSDVV